MKTQKYVLCIVVGLAVLICSVILWAEPMSTAFTYQGRLLDDNVAADGLYDMQFKLYDDPNILTGVQIGLTIDANDVNVLDGYFIADLDFGSGVFDGNSIWLEIAMRPFDSTDPGDYVALSPLQPIAPTPYARYAAASDWDNLANLPAGFADKVDDTGISAETDPTVLASVKDGVSWGEVSSRPAGLDDGDDVGITSEIDPQVGSNSTNYVPKWDGSALVMGTIYDNGNVGIGNQAPSSKLDIGSTSDAGNSIRIASNNSGSIVFYDAESTASGGLSYAHTNNSLNFTTENPGGGNSIKMAIDSDGNVGIGDQYPLAKLEVAGTIFSNTGGFKFPDGTTQATASQGDGHSLDAADGNPTDTVYVDNDGMVGIGNQNPYFKLDVGETTDSNNYLRIGSQNWSGVLFYDGQDLSSGGIKYSHSADALQFDTRDSGGASSTKVIVKSGGNVGIGTVNPTSLLEVAGTIEAENIGIGTSNPETKLHIKNQSETEHFQLKIANPFDSGANDGHAGILFHVEDDQVNRGKGGILYENIGYYNQGNMHFLQNNTADTSQASLSDSAMMIQYNGNVGIGTTGPTHLLHVNGIARSTQSTWATSSDGRVKENINELTNGLETVTKLRPVSFEYTEEYIKGNNAPADEQFGFVAQEVKEVVPEMVTCTSENVGNTTIEDFHLLNSGKLIPILVQAVKEQQEQIESMQTEIERLKGHIYKQ